jgi:hypothetical protein
VRYGSRTDSALLLALSRRMATNLAEVDAFEARVKAAEAAAAAAGIKVASVLGWFNLVVFRCGGFFKTFFCRHAV